MNGWVGGWVESWGDEEEKAPPGHQSECPEKDAPIARGLELGTFGSSWWATRAQLEQSHTPFLHTVYGCFHSVPELSSMT